MLIDCPACARSYTVSRDEIGAEGRVVICPRCETQWFVEGEGSDTVVGSPDDLRTTSFSRRPVAVEKDSDPPSRRSILHHIRPAVAAAACVLAAMGLLGARERIVRLIPRTAGLYATIGLPVNVRGLEIVGTRSEVSPSNVTPSNLASSEASPDVRISGDIHNVAQRRVGVPGLTYEIRDGAGAALVTWTERASARTLGAGKTLAFISAPHRLPLGARSVLVHFEDAAPTPIRLARR